MALNHDELALSDALDDLARDQSEAPAGRYAAVRRRVVRHRIRQVAAGGALAVTAALVAIAVAVPAGRTGSNPASSRRVPGWALPWPDHRNGSVPQRVLDGAVTAWRRAFGPAGRELRKPGRVIWYVGQTAAAGQDVAVIFEVAGPTGHRLVVGSARASQVMKGQPGSWALEAVRAPSPSDVGPAIGFNMPASRPAPKAGLDNWIVEMAGPRVRRLDWTAVTTSGTRAGTASTSRGLVVADTGQVTRQVLLTGLITSRGNVLSHAAYVGLPGTNPASQGGQPGLPVLALPAALRLPTSFRLVGGTGATGAGSIDAGAAAGDVKPGQREVIFARCYGPAPLQIRLLHHQDLISQHVLGVIRCDNAEHELLVPARQVLTHDGVNVQTGEMTSYWVDFGIMP